MSEIRVGDRHTFTITVEPQHSAEWYGNKGVNVAATPALIGFIENACGQCMGRHLRPDQGSVGIRVDVTHLAAAPIGAEVVSSALVTAVDGGRISFEADVKWGDKVLMQGRHQRAIVELERFLSSLPKA